MLAPIAMNLPLRTVFMFSHKFGYDIHTFLFSSRKPSIS